jgi:hypothetical protein
VLKQVTAEVALLLTSLYNHGYIKDLETGDISCNYGCKFGIWDREASGASRPAYGRRIQQQLDG